VSFDWKKAEQEDKKRSQRLLLPMGIGYTTMGIVGLAARLITGVSEEHPWLDILPSAGLTIIGGACLILYWRKRHRPPGE
jgi:hypothetical protein